MIVPDVLCYLMQITCLNENLQRDLCIYCCLQNKGPHRGPQLVHLLAFIYSHVIVQL